MAESGYLVGEGEQDQGVSGPVPDPGPDEPTASPVPPATEEAAGGTPGSDVNETPADDSAPGPLVAELLPAAPLVTRAPKRRRRRRLRRVLVSMVLTMAVLAAAAAASAYVMIRRFDNQITSEEVAQKIGPYRPPVMPEAYGAVNILLMGSDDRSGANVKYGDVGEGTKRSDTTILLHLAADRKSSVAVSIPRDLMVQIPSCTRDDGSVSSSYRDQFNHAFEIGGSACTIKTVELMTRVQIDHHVVIDFTGFKRMVDAVDGVNVCLSEPLRDSDAKLDLGVGDQKLDGEEALAFVRARKELGDGSDTQRMVRQQRFLASLMSKVKSDGVLFNPKKLYDLLDAGTSSITADPGLDSLDELTKLSKSVSNIPSDQSAFLTVPRQQYRFDTNRDELVQPDADALFTAIRYDRIAVGKAAPGVEVEPGGSVRIDETTVPPGSGPEPSSTAQPPGRRTTSQPSDSPSSKASSSSASSELPETSTSSGTSASSEAPAPSATSSPSGPSTASGTPGEPAPTGTAPGATGASLAPPPVPAGPIVTVTGRTPDQDTCA